VAWVFFSPSFSQISYLHFGKVLADTLQMLPLLSAELHSDNPGQHRVHNLTSNARGNILTIIMTPTALC